MTDLVPLLRQDLGAAEHALLDSASDDAPRPGSRDALLSALGVGVVAAGLTVTTGASAAGKAVGGIGAVVAKWLGAGVVAGALVSGAAAGLSAVHRAPEAASAPARPTAAPPLRGASESRRPLAPVATASAPAAAPPAAPSSTASPSPASSAERASRIAAELALIDRVRASVRQEPGAALQLLARHGREFPDGALRPEAALLRMDAERALGNDRAAGVLARRFLKEHPDSPYAERVRALLGRIDDRAEPAPDVDGNVGRFPPPPNR